MPHRSTVHGAALDLATVETESNETMSFDKRCRRTQCGSRHLDKPQHLTPAVAKDKATECFELAAAADHVAHRMIIEGMARTWERIAEILEDDRNPPR